MQALKGYQRERYRRLRRERSPLFVAAASAAVAARLRQFASYSLADAVVSYVAAENEVCTDAIHAELQAAGVPLYLPRVGLPPAFLRWDRGEALVRGKGGVLGVGAGEALGPDTRALVLLPLVAWDESGTRLGRGQGYYDQALENRHARTRLVGLGYEFQQCRELPADAWDVRLDYVITEDRVLRVPPGRPPGHDTHKNNTGAKWEAWEN